MIYNTIIIVKKPAVGGGFERFEVIMIAKPVPIPHDISHVLPRIEIAWRLMAVKIL